MKNTESGWSLSDILLSVQQSQQHLTAFPAAMLRVYRVA
jgi:hypothetical protein